MNVSQFISHQPEPNRGMMIVLRSWVLDLGHHTEEKISNKIPTFSFFGPLCYLNPTDDGVELGFTKGYELSDDDRILESKGRKMVKSVTFYSLTSLEEQEETIRHLLNEAAILNEYRSKRKTARKK
jgi:hypothetical protein